MTRISVRYAPRSPLHELFPEHCDSKKSEDELRAVTNTTQEAVDYFNKLIGASRAGNGEPRDLEFLDILAYVTKLRLLACRLMRLQGLL